MNPVIEDVFRPVYGKPCWQVRCGYASFLTLEFGEPHLSIQEPRQPGNKVSERVRKAFARRSVVVHGDWHLCVCFCDWRILSHGQFIADADSKKRDIALAIRELDGQALMRVVVSKSIVSVFEFDLGGRLEVAPCREGCESADELWDFYEPSGYVFTLRADGQYCHMPDGVTPDQYSWQPLGIESG